MDYDRWNFVNARSVFSKNYQLLPEDLEQLWSQLSPLEKEVIGSKLSETWKGSCYGMVVTALLLPARTKGISQAPCCAIK